MVTAGSEPLRGPAPVQFTDAASASGLHPNPSSLTVKSSERGAIAAYRMFLARLALMAA